MYYKQIHNSAFTVINEVYYGIVNYSLKKRFLIMSTEYFFD